MSAPNSVFAQITPEEVTRTPGGSQQFSLVIRGGEGDELAEWVVSGLDADLELIAPDQVPPRANSRTRHINILPDIPPQERTARVYVEAFVRSADGELLTSAEAVLNIDLRTDYNYAYTQLFNELLKIEAPMLEIPVNRKNFNKRKRNILEACDYIDETFDLSAVLNVRLKVYCLVHIGKLCNIKRRMVSLYLLCGTGDIPTKQQEELMKSLK